LVISIRFMLWCTDPWTSSCTSVLPADNIMDTAHHKHCRALRGYLYILDLINARKWTRLKTPEYICIKSVHLWNSCMCTVPWLLPSYTVLCCWSSCICCLLIKLWWLWWRYSAASLYTVPCCTVFTGTSAKGRPVPNPSVYQPNNDNLKLSQHISHRNK
jgi:hypothetical protein